MRGQWPDVPVVFLSTPSAKEGDVQDTVGCVVKYISIHALCERGRPAPARCAAFWFHHFYPRPLRKRATALWSSWPRQSIYFYPRPLRKRATQTAGERRAPDHISIHALCERGRLHVIRIIGDVTFISIHALCERGRPKWMVEHSPALIFLSTPSAKEGDMEELIYNGEELTFLSTPSAKEGDLLHADRATYVALFLSTPSAKEGDRSCASRWRTFWYFYPRPLRKRATGHGFEIKKYKGISIHALCERGRRDTTGISDKKLNISIHALCERGRPHPLRCPT